MGESGKSAIRHLAAGNKQFGRDTNFRQRADWQRARVLWCWSAIRKFLISTAKDTCATLCAYTPQEMRHSENRTADMCAPLLMYHQAAPFSVMCVYYALMGTSVFLHTHTRRSSLRAC
jgi:hypothetical protein